MRYNDHRFVVLDGMRGIAALYVMVAHCVPSRLAEMSYAAVDLFFMLSGFVLAHAFGASLATARQRRAFAIGRIARLWPLYLLATLLGAVAALPLTILRLWFWTPGSYAAALAAAPFFVPLPYEITYPFVAPAWSLAFELLANAVFMVTGAGRRRAAAIVLVTAPLLLWAMTRWQDAGGSTWDSLAGGVPRVLFSFFLGVLACRWWHDRALPRLKLPPIVFPIVLSAIYLYLPLHEKRYFALLVFVVQPLLIWCGASAVAPGRFGRFLSWLGLVSYGVYVLHYPILLLVEEIGRVIGGDMTGDVGVHWWTLAFVAPIAVGASHFLTTRWEGQARKKLRLRLTRMVGAEAR